MKTGFNAIRSNKGLYMLFGVSVMSALFVIPTIPLLPLITINHFNGGKFEMGLVEILWSIGMLVGSGVLSIWKPSVNKIFIINIMNIITGILLAWWIASFNSISHFYFSDGNVRSCILGRECNVYNNCSGKSKSGSFGTGILYVFQSDSFAFHDRAFLYRLPC